MPSDAKERLNQVQKAGNKITKNTFPTTRGEIGVQLKIPLFHFFKFNLHNTRQPQNLSFICIYVYKVSENCTTKLTKKKKN